MRPRSAFVGAFGLVSLFLACSSGTTPHSPDAGSGKGSGTGSGSGSGSASGTGSGSGSGSGSQDSGSTNPDAAVGPFTYTPLGCAYSVTPPSALAYTATALDNSSPAGDAGAATPTRVRLGLGGNTTESATGYPDPTTTAAFTWETNAANTAAKVQYGTSPTALGTVQTGYVWTLASTSTSGPSYMHEAHVCGLSPATTYYYQVGGGAPGAEIWSATQSFTTLPASGSITLGVYGDARDVVTTWQLSNERLKALNVSALLFTGDLILTGGEESLYTSWLDAIWQDPNNEGEFLTLGALLFLPVAGNHEYIFDATAEHFISAFAMPGSGPYFRTFNSFNIGTAHFVNVDDDMIANVGTSSPEAAAQLAWLSSDLAAANADRTNHPFIFVLGHRGLFSTAMHATDPDVLQARTLLAPIYAQFKVDAVFNGHEHEYERTVPIVPGTPVTGDPTAQTGGTTYIICGGVGADPYPVGASNPTWRAAHLAFGSAADSGPDSTFLGFYQTLTLSGATALVQTYGLTMAGNDPVVDSTMLTH